MITYTVHERDSDAQDIAARAEEIIFVKEGFAWLALAFPLVWLLYHRLWIVLAGFIAIVALLEVGVMSLELNDAVAVVTTFVLSGLFALQANDLRRWSLQRKGFELVDLVSGRDRSECEQTFFTHWLTGKDMQVKAAPGKTAKRAKPAPAVREKMNTDDDDVIGLFPEPGK